MANRLPEDFRGPRTPRGVANRQRFRDRQGAIPTGLLQVVSLPYAPWVMWVMDGQEPWWFGNAYLAFGVGQGSTMRQIRQEARYLVGPLSWCVRQRTPWTHMSREGWRRYWQELLWVHGGRDGVQTLRSLHHWYAFWQWHAPRLVPEMPLPQTAATQRRWLQEMDSTPPVWMRWTSPHPPE